MGEEGFSAGVETEISNPENRGPVPPDSTVAVTLCSRSSEEAFLREEILLITPEFWVWHFLSSNVKGGKGEGVGRRRKVKGQPSLVVPFDCLELIFVVRVYVLLAPIPAAGRIRRAAGCGDATLALRELVIAGPSCAEDAAGLGRG